MRHVEICDQIMFQSSWWLRFLDSQGTLTHCVQHMYKKGAQISDMYRTWINQIVTLNIYFLILSLFLRIVQHFFTVARNAAKEGRKDTCTALLGLVDRPAFARHLASCVSKGRTMPMATGTFGIRQEWVSVIFKYSRLTMHLMCEPAQHRAALICEKLTERAQSGPNLWAD